MGARLHGFSVGKFNHSPGQNIGGACVMVPSFPGCLAERLLRSVRVCGGLPLMPFVCSRDFSLLSFTFSLFSEVVQLGLSLVVAFLLGVELLLK